MSIAGMIVGLGNPGPQYEMTRHNMGYLLIDALLASGEASPLSGNKFRGEIWKTFLPESTASWLLVKPQTFMNLSGECVQPLAAWHRITPEQILVIHDELDLAPGRMKFKKGGGNAGHNGLKSITQLLGTPDFYRLRLGIGRSPHASQDTISWVLGKLSLSEKEVFRQMTPTALEVVRFFVSGDMAAATRTANGFRSVLE